MSGTFCYPTKGGKALGIQSHRSSLQEISLRKTVFLPITLAMGQVTNTYFLFFESIVSDGWGGGLKEQIGGRGLLA